ncbi:isoprene monooxygenase oxygenase subunit alpha [Mycolicibacterium gadium]|uniref:propane 2-monooxygenase n=1 Tax=Mycolicibacterium gadium TaxID=1794 RepID=A0ABT6GKQ4_MYCGU|nr:isoprene monooxygenase oxygenase subunit alpha [Mycolicibacterium gadium]MDG5481956.1 isoprene monooxygenase oxygenase subunit alpha [Mycolicibacterium gadium]
MLLNRDDWYDTSRDLDWDMTYVDKGTAFPDGWTGSGDIPKEAWAKWDEPFRVSYRDYVRIQREKEAGVKAVSNALVRAGIYEKLDPAHVAASHLHMGGTCMVEQMAVTMQSRFCRFAPSPAWRNLGVFGMLDETRHAQLDLRFSHDLLKADPRFDWAQKAFHTNEWGILAVKNFFDDAMLNADCVEASLVTSLTVEHGFTNLQFVALAADAMAAGDINWSNLLSSIQTDEARHAQQGFPTLAILMEHDPARAQRSIDVAFWRATRLFQTLTGPAMDYYTPLDQRRHSFKEFMLEWIVNHHERILDDYGLKKPWYWDQFMRALETGHHAMHLGTWYWRPTLFWKPNAGVSKDEREWLNEKYPTWEQDFGFMWDEIIANINSGKMELTLPETLPALCSLTQLPLGAGMGPHECGENSLMYKDRLYHFDSAISKWCFEQDPERYAGHQNIIDRFIAGEIQPPDLSGGLAYMSITPDVMGDDVYDYEWAKDYLPSNGNGKHSVAETVLQ